MQELAPDADFPLDLEGTADLAAAVGLADVLVMGVPSSGFRETLEEVRLHLRPSMRACHRLPRHPVRLPARLSTP